MKFDISLNIGKAFKLSNSNSMGLFNSADFFINQIGIIVAKNILFDPSNEKSTFIKKIENSIELLKNMPLYVPVGMQEIRAFEFMQKKLNQLKSSEHLIRVLSNIKKPYYESDQYDMIKYTLLLSQETNLHVVQGKAAALAALITPIRQEVGSCFATALAIEIQENQNENFLEIISKIISSGEVSFTYSGTTNKAYISNRPTIAQQAKNSFYIFLKHLEDAKKIPMLRIITGLISEKFSKEEIDELIDKFIIKSKRDMDKDDWSTIDLIQHLGKFVENTKSSNNQYVFSTHKHLGGFKRKSLSDTALLYASSVSNLHISRVFEFALATFSESEGAKLKTAILTSLGFQGRENNTIGDEVFDHIKQRLISVHEDLNYNINVYNQLQYTDYLKHQRNNESSASSMGSEAVLFSIHNLKNLQNTLTGLYEDIYHQLSVRAENFFAESYDPHLSSHNTYAGVLEDIPAGFRLMFKGSAHSTKMSSINTAEEFSKAMHEFIILSTVDIIDEIAGPNSSEEIKNEISEVLNIISQGITGSNFIQKCFENIANRMNLHLDFHANPKHTIKVMMDKNITPWSTPSGGSPINLLKNIYNIQEGLHSSKKSDASSLHEIISFWKETCKKIPSTRAVIATSPTHVFRLFPNAIQYHDRYELILFDHQDYFPDIIDEYFISFVSDISHKGFKYVFDQVKYTNNFKDLKKSIFSMMENVTPDTYEILMSNIFALSQTLSMRSIINQKNRLAELLYQKSKKSQDIDHMHSIIKDFITSQQNRKCTSYRRLFSFICHHCALITPFEDLFRSLKEIFNGFYPEASQILGDTNWACRNIILLRNELSNKQEIWAFDDDYCKGFPLLDWNREKNIRSGTWEIFSKPDQYNKSLVKRDQLKSFGKFQ